jgi:hypothetical protein
VPAVTLEAVVALVAYRAAAKGLFRPAAERLSVQSGGNG